MVRLADSYSETAPRRGTAASTALSFPVQGLAVTLYATMNGEEADVLHWVLKTSDRRLTERLIKAWVEKAFCPDLDVQVYHASAGMPEGTGFIFPRPGQCPPSGRTMSADLRRMGY